MRKNYHKLNKKNLIGITLRLNSLRFSSKPFLAKLKGLAHHMLLPGCQPRSPKSDYLKPHNIMKLLKYTILIAALCAAFTVQPAKAAPFISVLSVGNDDLSGFNGPFGTVTVTLSGQIATITFTADSGFAFVDTQAADVQINSTDFTADPLSVSPNTLAEPFTGFDSGQVDGFGTFNLRVNYKDASVPLSTISFMVTNNLNTWGSAADVLAFNGTGFDAAAHILVLNSGGITGKAGEGPGTPTVPDSGTTAMLLGGALAGLGAMRRYLKR